MATDDLLQQIDTIKLSRHCCKWKFCFPAFGVYRLNQPAQLPSGLLQRLQQVPLFPAQPGSAKQFGHACKSVKGVSQFMAQHGQMIFSSVYLCIALHFIPLYTACDRVCETIAGRAVPGRFNVHVHNVTGNGAVTIDGN